MANIKQQKKRIITDQKKTLRNKSFKSKIKTAYKKAVEAITVGKDTALTKINTAVKLLDQSVAKKIKHKNYASRKKSQLHKLAHKNLKNFAKKTPKVETEKKVTKK